MLCAYRIFLLRTQSAYVHCIYAQQLQLTTLALKAFAAFIPIEVLSICSQTVQKNSCFDALF